MEKMGVTKRECSEWMTDNKIGKRNGATIIKSHGQFQLRITSQGQFQLRIKQASQEDDNYSRWRNKSSH